MDKELIQRAMPTKSEPSKNDGCKSCATFKNLSPTISERLGNLPAEFLRNYPPRRANNIIAKGYSSGQVALLADIPTLADVETKFGNEIAVFWMKTLIDSVDMVLGVTAYPEEARNDIASLIVSSYKDMNIGEFLLFFARFKLGEYNGITTYTGGIQKIAVALRHYKAMRDADISRIYTAAYSREKEQERERWAARAISYDEYLKTKDQ